MIRLLLYAQIIGHPIHVATPTLSASSCAAQHDNQMALGDCRTTTFSENKIEPKGRNVHGDSESEFYLWQHLLARLWVNRRQNIEYG